MNSVVRLSSPVKVLSVIETKKEGKDPFSVEIWIIRNARDDDDLNQEGT